MSFMEGFGDSFSRSFELTRERNARRDDDFFRMTYDRYLKRQDAIDERDRESKNQIRLAKALVEQSGAPEGAWVNAFEWLSSGMDQKSVAESLSRGNFEALEPQGAVEGTSEIARPQTPAEMQTMDAMSGEQGMQAPQAPQAPQPKQGSNWSNILPSLLGPRRPKQDKAVGRISEMTGESPEAIQATLKGGQSGVDVPQSQYKFVAPLPENKGDPINDLKSAEIELAQATTAAEGNPTPRNIERATVAQQRVTAIKNATVFEQTTRANADKGIILPGQYVKVPSQGRVIEIVDKDNEGNAITRQGEKFPLNELYGVADGEQKELISLAKDVQPQQEAYNRRSEAIMSSMRDFAEIDTVISMTGEAVLAERTAGLAQTLEGWAQEANAAMQVLSRKDPNAPADPRVLADAEAKVNKALQDGIQNQRFRNVESLGTARSLIEAKRTILAYRLASLNGQEGKSVAEKEREAHEQLALAGNTQEKFRSNAASIINAAIRDQEAAFTSLTENNARIEGFMNTFPGWEKPPFEIASPIFDRIQQDPITAKSYEVLKPYDALPNNLLNNKPDQPPAPVGAPQQVAQPNEKHIQALRANPSMAEQFDKKFGPGAAAAILQGN